MTPSSAVIVDDEPLSRRELRRLLAEFAEIEVVGEAASVAEAAELIERRRPALVFLDVQLGGETGLELLDRIGAPSQVLLVTAFTDQSLATLGLPVLVKPVSPKRLRRTLEPYLA
jgi:two-component system LytT family response regulator